MMDIMRMVDAAREKFERNWRPSSIACVDGELYDRFMEQSRLYEDAVITGTEADAEEQGEAMVRAYQAVTERMSQHCHDAYMIGHDRVTDTTVIISKYQQDRPDAIWVTPETVAKIVHAHNDVSAVIVDQEGAIVIP